MVLNGVDRLLGQVIEIVVGLRQAAKITLGHIVDFVVVIEDHALKARNAEVFLHHVARKNIRAREIPDRTGVIVDHLFPFLRRCLGEVFVQRCHTPFDVAMPNDELIGIQFNRTGHFGL